jgi:hypothetical protein
MAITTDAVIAAGHDNPPKVQGDQPKQYTNVEGDFRDRPEDDFTAEPKDHGHSHHTQSEGTPGRHPRPGFPLVSPADTRSTPTRNPFKA